MLRNVFALVFEFLVDDITEEWEIDKVLSKRVHRGETEYLIGWKDLKPTL